MKLLLLAAALACSAASWEPAVPAPKGWSAHEGDGGATLLSGPKAELPLSPLISIRRYADGGAEFKDAAAYVKVQSEPGIVALKGVKPASADRIKVKKGEFSRVTRYSTEFIPPDSVRGEEIPVHEEHVVVPAKGGFYVLIYAAPEKGFAKNRKAFERVLESFTARARP